MNSPYMGKFQVTQEYKGSQHDGLDLVGLDSKKIHSTVNGTVIHADWENPKDYFQGFGQYVCIQSDDDKNFYYFGHLSEIRVQTGQHVNITDVIGIEGNTGFSSGSHCHYCVRPEFCAGNSLDISAFSGIPNALGTYDDGYISGNSGETPKKVSLTIDGVTYSGTLTKS